MTKTPKGRVTRAPRSKLVTREPLAAAVRRIAAAVPGNWLDGLLVGPEGMGKQPWGCRDVEKLLNGVRERITAVALHELAVARKPRRQAKPAAKRARRIANG